MKEIIGAGTQKILTLKTRQQEQDVFEVIRDHRAIALKKRRKLLRQRNIQMRATKVQISERDDLFINEQLNKNMFNDDDLWEVLVQGTLEFKKTQESNITETSTASSIQNALRIIAQIPIIPKRDLFIQGFEQINFNIQF